MRIAGSVRVAGLVLATLLLAAFPAAGEISSVTLHSTGKVKFL